ncbi:MAG TPA: GIY-YIG nuclease family protein [Candidatus Bathyarchaeota archaeon]|nr:GIY-YIG nuclease family protein [Candidatus Bathyarchaeota archaeon]
MRTEANTVSEFPVSGIYMLLLRVPREVTLTVGKLGKHRFPRGYYVYTGSALGKGAAGLKHRIARHLRKEKRRFWHLDYLLADENVSVEAVIAAETNENMECSINSHIKGIEGAEVPVKGFGASDCKENCGSHLLYFPAIEKSNFLVQKLVRNLRSACGTVSMRVIH